MLSGLFLIGKRGALTFLNKYDYMTMHRLGVLNRDFILMLLKGSEIGVLI